MPTKRTRKIKTNGKTRKKWREQQTKHLNNNNNANNNSGWDDTPEIPEEKLLPPIRDPKFPNIFNLARIHLSQPEKQLLGKGLKFCPDPGPPNTSENQNSIKELIRKIKINAAMIAKK